MKLRTKQLSALGLLLLTALPLFLSVGIFCKQKMVQNDRNERFNTELLQTITIPAQKLNWLKPGKEILVNGKLFDVKHFKTSGANFVLTGFFDTREDKLVKNIRDLIHEKEESNSPANLLALTFLFYPNYKENTVFTIQNNWQIIARQFPFYAEALSSPVSALTAPPPKYC